jgi:hypothetical protein
VWFLEDWGSLECLGVEWSCEDLEAWGWGRAWRLLFCDYLLGWRRGREWLLFLEAGAGAVGEGIMLDSSNQRVWEEGWAAKRRKGKAEKRRKQNTYSSSCSEDECSECDQCNSVGQPIHVYKPFPIWDLVWMSATSSRWYVWFLFPPYLSTFLNLQ